ncbi:hypothetical protein BGW38_003761 [Lunasporangiospora selenospora]|uniref:Adhesin domain-containing protein n=1 Tax=Lunasporangiospora selenospora TaxID=979761 RepID=A0A9P6G0S1_9FUNG|nr:hypothetical protein BGW38_003761 [Lunasporangiospora selenospora]
MLEHHINIPADNKQYDTLLEALINQEYCSEAHRKKERRLQRRKAKWCFLSVLYVFFVYFGFLHPATHHYLGRFLHRGSSGLENNGNSQPGSEVSWDGPAIFKTEADNFKLYVSGKRLTGGVYVKQQPVDQVELHIEGTIRYDSASVKVNAAPIYKGSLYEAEDTLHRGLRISIRETATDFIAMIRLEEEGDDGNGNQVPLSADLQFTIVFPEDYSSYKSLSIETKPSTANTLNIHLLEKLEIEFLTLNLQASSGSIEVAERIVVKNLITYSLLGTDIFEVLAVPGEPIMVSSNTASGTLDINVLTSSVDSGVTQPNRLFLGSGGGEVYSTIGPDPDSADSEHAGINLSVNTVSGLLHSTVRLADESQVLLATVKSFSGSIDFVVSDKYSGSLGLSSEFESVELLPKENSKSKIVYEEKTSSKIVATKSLASSPDVGSGKLALSSPNGQVRISFE